MSEPLAILSLRGGQDDTSPRSAMAADACDLAQNIEFVRSTCGERRKGCTTVEMESFFSGYDAVVWQYRHLPSNDEGDAQLWAFAQDLTAPYANKLGYKDSTGWHEVTLDDPIDATPPNGHRISAASLHGKLFLAYKSDVNRLHVAIDGVVRRTGLAEPDPIVATDTGSGSYVTARFFRVRLTEQIAGTTVRRSEPSEVYEFTPSGSGSGASIPRPTLISEGETHWEVEASLDNANFYVLAAVDVGTATYTDTVDAGDGYAQDFELSEDIGDYTLIQSVRLLTVDEDRLVAAGNYDDPDEDSRVVWTPVFGNPTGAGNDERLELDTDPFTDLDGYEGGALTTLSRATNGYLYAGKREHTYRLVRKGQRSKAYEAFPLTKAVGSLPGSLVEAIDQAGNPSLYQLDLKQGVYRQGAAGLQWCGRDLKGRNDDGLWSRVNPDALVPCHGIYHSDKRQVHYWLALDGEDYPNAKIVLHVNEMRDTEEGARRGCTTVPVDDVIALAHCSVMFAENLDDGDPMSHKLVPFIGVAHATQQILRCDTGTDDNGTDYRARGRTRPFMPGQMLQHIEVKNALIMCEAVATADAEIGVKAIVDFGKDSVTKETDMEATGTETDVFKPLDSLSIAEARAVQFEFGDLAETFVPSDWAVNAIIATIVGGQKQ